MTTRLARFLSVVLHPLLMPTLLFGLLLFAVPGVLGLDAFSPALRLSLLILIFVGTFAVPSLLIYYLFRTGYVRSMHLTDLADRRLPYLLTALIYALVTYWFAFRLQLVSTLAPQIAVLLGGIAVSVLCVGVISLYWQISAHSVGLGGVLGSLGGIMLKFSQTDLFFSLLILVLLTGLVASARLKLNAHTPIQVSAGLALGLVVGLGTVFWLV